ncbi:Hsp20/alpha crystallin family protein [Chloroflexi bacterium]|nr:Hsp20/alpha crystallin family protein [Chloroflexota bacterium]
MLQSMFPIHRNTIDSLFDSTVSAVLSPYPKRGVDSFRNKIPIDLIDNGQELVLIADLPGYNSSDIQVNLERDYLKIEVTNEDVSPKESGDRLLVNERSRASVKRYVKLTEPVDSENAKSKYSDGVLEIQLPKSHKSQIKVIPVN